MFKGLFASRSAIGKATKQAQKLLAANQAREASKVLADAIEEARAAGQENEPEFLEALVLRGKVEVTRAHYQYAFDLYAEVVHRCEEGSQQYERYCVESALRAAEVYLRHIEGDGEVVRRLAATTSDGLIHLTVQSLPDFLSIIDDYIRFMTQIKSWERLQEVMLKAEMVVAQRCAKDRLLCGEMQLRMSRCWSMSTDPDEVLRHALEAKKIFEEIGDAALNQHTETVRRIAACQVRIGNRSGASDVLSESSERLAQMPKADQRPRVEFYARMAHVALRQENLEAAERAADKALDLSTKLKRVQAEGPRLAMAAKAAVAALKGKEEEAMIIARSVISQIHAGEEDRVRLLLPVCEGLLHAGAMDTALTLTSDVLEKLELNRPVLDEHLIDANLLYCTILREKGKPDFAEQRVFELLERLDDENQLDTGRHGRVLIEVADLRTQQRRFDEADEILSSAMYMVMDEGEIEGDLSGTVLNRMAFLNMKKGELETARELFERSREILESRGAFGGRNRRLYDDFMEKHSQTS